MRMIPACFARALQRCTSSLCMHFLLTFQEVMTISKTRNQLYMRASPALTLGASIRQYRSRLGMSARPQITITNVNPASILAEQRHKKTEPGSGK